MPKQEISLYRVVAHVLKVVGAQLVQQPDPPPLLAKIDEHPPALFSDQVHSLPQLIATVAAQGTQYVAGKTFRVNPNQHVTLSSHLAHDQSQMLFVILVILIKA